jgi:hypothetical protein
MLQLFGLVGFKIKLSLFVSEGTELHAARHSEHVLTKWVNAACSVWVPIVQMRVQSLCG